MRYALGTVLSLPLSLMLIGLLAAALPMPRRLCAACRRGAEAMPLPRGCLQRMAKKSSRWGPMCRCVFTPGRCGRKGSAKR